MANIPTYDPNLIEDDFEEIASIQAPCRPVAPLINRATNGLYAPGSTFKVVTAAAAIDSGKYTPTSKFVDPGYCEVYGKRVNNYDTTSPFGELNLRDALRYSVNSVFCNIGKDLGSKRIVEYAKRFGFYSTPPLETPSNERAPSGLYQGGELFDPELDSDVDPGRFAFGQERLLVTPLQMAMVAGTIANDGMLMRPFVIDEIRDSEGPRSSTRTKPDELGRAVEPETARAVGAMMRGAVEFGTGTAAKIPGLPVVGQDRNGGDRRARPQHDLVHLLRRTGRPAGRGRGRRRAAGLDGRPDRRADRPRRLAGTLRPDAELLGTPDGRQTTPSSTRSSTGAT